MKSGKYIVAGNTYYCFNGAYHREDGPALEFTNGYKAYWVYGKIHRLDGPAVIAACGDKYWYVNNRLHRTDGPAIEYTNGDKYWYYNGDYIFVNSQEEFERYLKLLVFI